MHRFLCHRDLWHQWRRQFSMVSRRGRPPRECAALTFLFNTPRRNGLVEFHQLTAVIVYDRQNGLQSEVVMRSYSGEQVQDGVAWGGSCRCQLERHLNRPPRRDAWGLRFDVGERDLLEASLSMDWRMEIHRRRPNAPRGNQLRLPPMWLGFPLSLEGRLFGKGPEFAAAVEAAEGSEDLLISQTGRIHAGQLLLPLDWIGHHWRQSIAAYADFSAFPRRQIFNLADPAEGLTGYQGASTFDFYRSPMERWTVAA